MDRTVRLEQSPRYVIKKRMCFTLIALRILLAMSRKVIVLIMLLPPVEAIAFTFGDYWRTTERSAEGSGVSCR